MFMIEVLFFFFKQKTAYEMRISDWSSDVCSSDLFGSELDLDAYLDSYLSPRHRDNPGFGCPTAGLVSETRHQAPTARAAMTQGFRAQVERLSKAIPGGADGDKRRAAIGSWAAMIEIGRAHV